MKAHVRVVRQVLVGADRGDQFFEFGWTGRWRCPRSRDCPAGTPEAAEKRSASGVLNMTGCADLR